MARTTATVKKAMSGTAPQVKSSLKQICMTSGRMARVISSRARAARGTSNRATRSASVESILLLSTLTMAPSSPVCGGILLPTAQWMDQWPTNRFCYLCHDGMVCQYCLGLVEVKPEICAADISFKCPGCHELGERNAKCKLSPYHGPLSSEVSAKGHPRLKSLPKLLYTSLEDYHTQDSLVYEEVFFDFGTDEKLV
ncbi:hypothetical protein BKA83DRAFT_4126194 [Pisolithus microcarpus]|nr:hypothetical protein BKA83DRAFT_4126194 [Pisolithus microcarpus]